MLAQREAVMVGLPMARWQQILILISFGNFVHRLQMFRHTAVDVTVTAESVTEASHQH